MCIVKAGIQVYACVEIFVDRECSGTLQPGLCIVCIRIEVDVATCPDIFGYLPRIIGRDIVTNVVVGVMSPSYTVIMS